MSTNPTNTPDVFKFDNEKSHQALNGKEKESNPSCSIQNLTENEENIYRLYISNSDTKNPLFLTQIINENIEFLKKNDFEIVNIYIAVTDATILYKNSKNKLLNFEQITTYSFTDFIPLEGLSSIDLSFEPDGMVHSLNTPSFPLSE